MDSAMISIPSDQKIASPSTLSWIIIEIKKNISSGLLEQVYPESEMSIIATKESIHEIPDQGPWMDYIEMYFKNTKCSSIYKLTAETFHGTGGEWKLIVK